jgi:preprotein translocase subunit SecG
MRTVLLVVYLMIVMGLIGVVLLQRSEGGGLGVGQSGGFLTSRGTANVLTRTTAVLAAAFFLMQARLCRSVPLPGTRQHRPHRLPLRRSSAPPDRRFHGNCEGGIKLLAGEKGRDDRPFNLGTYEFRIVATEPGHRT